ncbi:MAG: hypothetical protein AAF907_05910, partial [Planctomycetota bacterium]
MRLLFAAPRAISHTAEFRRRLTALLSVAVLSAPALLHGTAAAAEPGETPAPVAASAEPAAEAEGVVSLRDVPRPLADAAVQPAGLLSACEAGCTNICDIPDCAAPCGPSCDGCGLFDDPCGAGCGLLGCRGLCLPCLGL